MVDDIKKKTIKDSILMLINSGLGQFLQTIRGFLVAKFLGPALLGIWSNLLMILSYAIGLDLGVNIEFSRSYPRELARENNKECKRLLDVTFTFNFILGFLFVLGMCIYIFIKHNSFTSIFNVGLFTIAILLFLQRIFGFLKVAIRAFDDFKNLFFIGIFFSFINLISAGFLVYLYKLKGIYIAVVLTYILSILFTVIIRPIEVKFEFNFNKMFKMILPGLSFMAISYFYILVKNIDKTFILIFLGHTELGYYHFSIMITSFIALIPMTIGGTLFPKLSYRYGKSKDIMEMENLIYKPSVGVSYILMFITGYSFILIPFLIKLIMPEYLLSISPFLIILFGLFLFSLSAVVGNFLLVIHRQIDIIKVYIITILVCIITDYVLLMMGFGIIGVAYGTSATYFMYGIGVILYAFRYISDSKREMFKKFINILIPFIICFIGLLIIFLIENYYRLEGDWIYLQRAILFSIFAVPFGLNYYLNQFKKEKIW